MVAWLPLFFVAAAQAGEPSLSVTIEGREQYIPWEERFIGQTTLAVRFRVDSDQTAEVEVTCTFRVPRLAMKTIHTSRRQVVAGKPAHGGFRQWAPGPAYRGDDWDVDCEARPR